MAAAVHHHLPVKEGEEAHRLLLLVLALHLQLAANALHDQLLHLLPRAQLERQPA